MKKNADDKTSEQFAWSVSDWAHATGISRASVYNLLGEDKLESVKFGCRRLITTHPRDFIDRLAAKKLEVA